MGCMWANKLKLNPEMTEVLYSLNSQVREVGRWPVLEESGLQIGGGSGFTGVSGVLGG